MLSARLWACLSVLAYSTLVFAQAGPNTVARYHHNLRTNSGNGSLFIIPMDKAKVAAALSKYPLGPVPRNDKSLFPNGFPKDKHPVLVSSILSHDIRRGNLEIDWLYGGGVYVPYVDANGDGTPLQYALSTFIGGAFGKDLEAVVPALVGSANTGPLLVGKFFPNDAAYQPIGPNEYSAQIKEVSVPNPISGPGVYPSALDLQFSPTTKPRYTARAFRTMTNQPLILRGTAKGNCQANVMYYNESFANPITQRGSVTLYPGPVPEEVAGTFDDVDGYSVNGELIGFNPKKCTAYSKS